MDKTKKLKILFISHASSMTGAPLYLLHLCSYIKNNTDWEICFLLKEGGPLKYEFLKLGKTYVLNDSTVHTPSTAFHVRILHRIRRLSFVHFLQKSFILKKFKKKNFDLIYSNTFANGEIIDFFSNLKKPIITHAHELELVINSFGLKNLQSILNFTDYYITSSPSVTKTLNKKLGIPATQILSTKYFPIHNKLAVTDKATSKKKLGIPDDCFVVGSAGTVEWRKGWDLFIDLAIQLRVKQPLAPIYLVWVGNYNKEVKSGIDEKLSLNGLNGIVLFTGQSSDPMSLFSAFDVFCLMSREEAFGIVALEAALYHVPIICFEMAEGLASFVHSDAGYVISDSNTELMAESIIHLYLNPDNKVLMGTIAANRTKSEYTLEAQANVILNYIQKIV